MKTIIFTIMVLSFITISAQKANLSSLPEKEREEYLLKTAYDAVMKHAPEWYRDYKKPEIKAFLYTNSKDSNRGRTEYSIKYFYDPRKEYMPQPFSIKVLIWEDTGEVRGFAFPDRTLYLFPANGNTRNSEKPYVRPLQKYKRPINEDGSVNLGGS